MIFLGNRAWRPLQSDKPSFFLESLSQKLIQFGLSEDLGYISRKVVEDLTTKNPEVVQNNRLVKLRLLPMIAQSSTFCYRKVYDVFCQKSC